MTLTFHSPQLSRSTRTKYRRLTILIILILSPFALIYQLNGTRAEKYRADGQPVKSAPQQQASPCTHCKPPSEQVIYAPLFDLPEAASSEIVLNCRSPHEMEVRPTFYMLDGTPIVGDVIHLQPAEMRFVNTKSLIPPDERNRQRWGGISFSYTGNSMEMWAQLTLHAIHGGGSASILFIVVNQQRSNTSEAVWWTPQGGETVIALGNSSDQPVHANLIFPNSDTRGADIAPFATEIVRLRSQGADQSSSKAGKVEAVSISYTGPSGSLIPAGITSSSDGKFTSMIRFYDTQNVVQPNLYANNLRLKDSEPRMVLRNTSSGVITARPKFLTDAGTPLDAVNLPAIRLEPYKVADVNLQPLMAAAKRSGLESVSVQVISSGGAGSLIGSLYSSNSKTGVVYDVPLRDYGPPRLSAGGYPVRLDGDYTTVLSITNVSDKSGRFTLQINYPGGAYTYELIEISAGETKTFDVRKLRNEQTPDRDGHTLPRDMATGQIRWSARGDGSVRMIGRAEVVSLADGVSSSYSCGICCQNSFYDGSITPDEADFFVGESQQFTAKERQQDCYGNIFGPYEIGSMGSWDSSDTSIADVDFRGLATGIDMGSVEISCTWTADYWREDLNTMCEDYQEPYTEEAFANVAPQITLINAKVFDITAPFEGFSAYTQTATIKAGSSSHANEICGNDPQEFTLTISFKLPPGGELVESRCSVTPDGIPDHDYLVGTPTCAIDDSATNKGHLSVQVRRRCCSANDQHPGIRFVIGANKTGQTGNIDTPGRVNILCAQ